MTGQFGALSNGAVYEETDRCTCGYSSSIYPHEPECGLELVGFIAGPDFAIEDEGALLPSMLWDFSGVDYSAGPHTTSTRVSERGR